MPVYADVAVGLSLNFSKILINFALKEIRVLTNFAFAVKIVINGLCPKYF